MTGVDVDPKVGRHRHVRPIPRTSRWQDVAALPFDDATRSTWSVSFETIEHVPSRRRCGAGPESCVRTERWYFDAEQARVPRTTTSSTRSSTRDEFVALLRERFDAVEVLLQRNWLASAVLDERAAADRDGEIARDVTLSTRSRPSRPAAGWPALIAVCGYAHCGAAAVVVTAGTDEAHRLAVRLESAERTRRAVARRVRRGEGHGRALAQRVRQGARALRGAALGLRQERGRLETVYGSRSWRLLEPLRRAAGALRGRLAEPVSVAIPVRNGRPWLDEVISSVKRQRLNRPVELLVADSGSTDGSRDLRAAKGARSWTFRRAHFRMGARAISCRGTQAANTSRSSPRTPCQPTSTGSATLLEGFSRAPDVALVYGPYQPRPDASPMVHRELDGWFRSLAPDGTARLDRGLPAGAMPIPFGGSSSPTPTAASPARRWSACPSATSLRRGPTPGPRHARGRDTPRSIAPTRPSSTRTNTARSIFRRASTSGARCGRSTGSSPPRRPSEERAVGATRTCATTPLRACEQGAPPALVHESPALPVSLHHYVRARRRDRRLARRPASATRAPRRVARGARGLNRPGAAPEARATNRLASGPMVTCRAGAPTSR